MATKRDTDHSAPGRQHGLTLLELAIVVAVVAIVAASAAPSFGALVDARRLDGAATRLAADLQFVRSEAIARNQPLRLSVFAGVGASCWIVHTGAPADCACSGDSRRDLRRRRPRDQERRPARQRARRRQRQRRLDRLRSAARHEHADRHAAPDRRARRAVHHVVNVVGRVRSCSPGGAAPGYLAC